MTKTTFLGYVPSLKSKHEATIVNGRAMKSKGGSIRYLLEGEYDGRKTLPKTVSKEDFVKVYGFDAKEAEAVIMTGELDGKDGKVNIFNQVGRKDDFGFKPETIVPIENEEDITQAFVENAVAPDGTKVKDLKADTVGSPSPADVEPPAPSEKPFPQEPSNENFSAEDYGWVITHKDSGLRTDSFRTKSQAEKYRDELKQNKTLRTGMKIVKANSNDEPMTLNTLNYLDGKDAETEVKEEEPKTQEFTVVLQEGDKLELVDIPEEKEEEVSDEKEEQEALPDDETTEKEEETAEIEEKAAETLEVTDIDWETDDEDVDLPASVLVPSSVVEDEIADYLSDEYGFLVRGYVLNAESEVKATDCDDHFYEAVQAKVTRPVKEDETEDEEEESDEEGLSTGAKVALGVGALAVGAAIFGAEGEYPEEFLDEFYDFDSNPTADTQDEETIAIAYAAWLESKKNEDDYIPYESETDYSRIYGATSGEGYISHDPIYQDEERTVEIKYDDPTTYYDWTSPIDVDEDEVEEAIDEELGREPGEGAYGATLEVRSQSNPDKYVDVDVDMDTDYNEGRYMGMAAEHESESDGYTYAYTKGHKDGMDNEVIYRPSIETDREKTIFKKILKQKAEAVYISGIKDDKRESRLHIVGDEDVDGFTPKEISDFDTNNLTPYETNFSKRLSKNHADTIGNPSPSGPSSTPEPAEATGSEPSNEEFKSDNTKMALGLLGLGIGAVALLGGDRIKKLFDRFG